MQWEDESEDVSGGLVRGEAPDHAPGSVCGHPKAKAHAGRAAGRDKAAAPDVPQDATMSEALTEIGAVLCSSLEPEAVVDGILNQLRRIVPHDSADILLLDGENLTSLARLRDNRRESVRWVLNGSVADMPALKTMAETLKPVVVKEAVGLPGWAAQEGSLPVRSYAGAPIRVKDRVIGFLGVNSSRPGFFSDSDAERLFSFADHAGIAIENASLYNQIRIELGERRRAEEELRRYQTQLEELVAERTRELSDTNEALRVEVMERHHLAELEREARQFAESLREAGMALSSTLEFDQVLDRILVEIGRVVPFDCCSIFLVAGDSFQLIRKIESWSRTAKADCSANVLESAQVFQDLLLQNAVGMLSSLSAVEVGDVRALEAFASLPHDVPVRSLLVSPVSYKGTLLASIVLGKNEAGFFTPEMVDRVGAFAHNAAMAVENARLFRRTQELAITDNLTRLYNRHHFFVQGEHLFQIAKRHGKDLSAIMLDLDHFKKVNDTYGHSVGDRVLMAAAQTCRDVLRKTDILGRYGGEEFVLLLPETDLSGAVTVGENLRRHLSEKVVAEDGNRVSTTASLGVAQYLTDSDRSLDDLLKRADQALYHAKRHGRNRVCASGCYRK